MGKIKDRIYLFLTILMVVLFVPIFLCVIFVGNGMDYFVGLKLTTLLPNWVLFLIASIGLGVICLILWMERDHFLSERNWIANIVFALLFVCVYFINARITREIAFKLPWDIMVVRGAAYEVAKGKDIGYFYYLSTYSNNIPIVYILGRLFRKAREIADYPYAADFIWMQVNCFWFSVGGCFSCLLVKKLTNKLVPTVLVFLLYLALVGSSPGRWRPIQIHMGWYFLLCVYIFISVIKTRKKQP